MFDAIKVHSEYKQEKPYRPLDEAIHKAETATTGKND